MKVSIVVPAFNEAKLITASLRQINTASRAFHERPWTTELIVCDNNSTDETPDLAQAEGARVVFEPFNQIGRARIEKARKRAQEGIRRVAADVAAAHFCEAEVT